MIARGVFSAATRASRVLQGVILSARGPAVGGEGLGDAGGAVEDRDGEALLGDVEREGRAHGAEADQSDVRCHGVASRSPPPGRCSLPARAAGGRLWTRGRGEGNPPGLRELRGSIESRGRGFRLESGGQRTTGVRDGKAGGAQRRADRHDGRDAARARRRRYPDRGRRHRRGGSRRGGGCRGGRRPRLRGDARPRQHPPPSLPVPDPGGAGGAGCAALRLAHLALSDLGADAARGHVRLGAARACRAGALGLHDECGPPLSLPGRGAARGHDRGGADGRDPLSSDAGGDERRRERRRAAARQPGREGGGDPRRHGAGGGRLPRSEPGRDAPRRAGALLAVLGLDRADEGRRRRSRATRG